MRRVIIEVKSEAGVDLIESLEKLGIINIVAKPDTKLKVDESWAGSISKETADKMLEYLEESRNEWDRDNQF